MPEYANDEMICEKAGAYPGCNKEIPCFHRYPHSWDVEDQDCKRGKCVHVGKYTKCIECNSPEAQPILLRQKIEGKKDADDM